MPFGGFCKISAASLKFSRFRFTPKSDFPKREADRILIDFVDSSRENSTSSIRRMRALVNSA